MRTFVLFTLALAGAATVVDDASAGPFRRTSGAAPVTAYYPAPVPATAAPAPVESKAPVFMSTTGTIYRLGSDGNYYAVNSGLAMSDVSTLGGFTTQPYSSGFGTANMYYNGRYMLNGAYPSGYYGGTFPRR